MWTLKKMWLEVASPLLLHQTMVMMLKMFSIVKIHASEKYHTLAEKEYYLLAVRTKHTERHNSESTIYNW